MTGRAARPFGVRVAALARRGPAMVVVMLLLLTGCVPDRSGTNDSPSPGYTLPAIDHTYPAPDPPDRPAPDDSDAQPPGFTRPPAGSGYSRYLDQKLRWTQCDEFRCVTFRAPLDWSDPDGQAITLAMRMKPASAPERHGVLFINPGGPGSSAQEYVPSFDTTGLESFDIIGLDSRGSGESTPVVCGTGEQTDDYYLLDATPDDQAERDALIAGQQQFNGQCRRNSGRLLDHISTIEAMHDYDLARHLLGEAQLNFYGVSYGTFLGAVYAELYPENVGRVVLDSAVNLTPDSDVIQAQGFDLSLRNFAAWCEQNSQQCRLAGTEQEVVDEVVTFITGLDAAPLPTTDPERPLTQSLALTGLVLHFYFGAEIYPYLAQLLEYTLTFGDGSYLLEAADLLNERNPDGTYGGLTYAFPAIRCVDETDDGVQAAFDTWTGRDTELAPIFGPLFGPDLVCPLWTARPAPQIDFTGAGAPPLLVIQNTGDSATPYRNAEIMAEELASAVLVVRDAPGHGAYASGSACMDGIVTDYFTTGAVPAEGTICTDG
ncbi:MAG: alpha/beta hydrolase [Brooklawnia sp.]|uniref:alpha/beta hydrolase n=1 Tax=Brooklawnia sp. TaxID=2699740 RepID=UPI003C75C6E7